MSTVPLPPPSKAFAETPPIGAGVVHARQQRGSPLRWIAAVATACVLAGIGYVVTQDSPSAAAGSAAQPVVPPVAARTPAVAPAPPKPVHVDPPPPAPAPAQVRLRIVSHPADATVMLDGKKFGRTPLDETIEADPGKHVIKLRRKGYMTYRIDVSLDADLNEDLTLAPQR